MHTECVYFNIHIYIHIYIYIHTTTNNNKPRSNNIINKKQTQTMTLPGHSSGDRQRWQSNRTCVAMQNECFEVGIYGISVGFMVV